MSKKNKDKIKVFFGALLGVAGFVLLSQFAQQYNEDLRYIVGMGGYFGMLFYVFVMMMAIVIAPIGVGFLLPIAANVWGPFIAGTLSITGWTLGAVIAFYLARRYGRALVGKFFSLESLEKVEKMVPEKYTFWTIVFLRISLPVDIISYAMGLFKFIRFTPYFFATLLGVAPFSYMFTYSATLPMGFQIFVSVLGVIIFFVGVRFLQKQYKKSSNQK